jgi:lactoylglutathione lyase
MESFMTVPVSGIFEAHLPVTNLDRSIVFYRDVAGLQLAHTSATPRAAFFWVGGVGKSMLGLWEGAPLPFHKIRHTAFEAALADLHEAPARLAKAGVIARDFAGLPTNEPVVLAWMPAASIYFNDPDENLLEFIAMLPDPPKPGAGVVRWNEWNRKTRD